MKAFVLSLLFSLLTIPVAAQTCGSGVNHCAQLSWTQGTGGGTPTGNNVYRTTSSGGCATVTASTCHLAGSTVSPALTFLDQPLAASTTYFWVVTATNVSATGAPQESAPSNQATGTTGPDPINVPSAPTGVSATAK